MEPEIIYIADDEGNEIACELLGMFEEGGTEYAGLLVQEGEFEGELMFFKVEDDEEDPDMENFVNLDDPDEMETCFEIFKELFPDYFEEAEEE